MKRLLTAAAAATIALTGAAGTAMAQPYGHDQNRGYEQGRGDDHRGDQDRGDQNRGDQNRGGYSRDDRGGHHHWQRGQRISHNEWGHYSRVDWRRHHLRQPPRGYEWRQSNDGNYVMAAIATGLIASIIANSH